MATTVPTRTTLRLLIVVEVLLGIGSLVAYSLGESSLPEALRTFEPAVFATAGVNTLGVILCILVLLLIALFVAWIGLFLFWRPARLIYLVVTILALIVMPFFGPYVETGLSYTLTETTSIVAGIILALIYWSPLKDLFEKPKTAI